MGPQSGIDLTTHHTQNEFSTPELCPYMIRFKIIKK